MADRLGYPLVVALVVLGLALVVQELRALGLAGGNAR
jgi:hypothetical protein